MRKRHYNNNELDVLAILWNTAEELSATDIAEKKAGLAKQTVQAAVTSLLKKETIKVANVQMRNKALTRVFLPTIDREKFILSQYPHMDFEKLLMILVKKEEDSLKIEKLTELIQERRQQLS